jgi:hypothetical protein
VVEERDPDERSDLSEAAGQLDIGRRRRAVSRYGEVDITGVMCTSALCGGPTVPPTDRWLKMAT